MELFLTFKTIIVEIWVPWETTK